MVDSADSPELDSGAVESQLSSLFVELLELLELGSSLLELLELLGSLLTVVGSVSVAAPAMAK